MKYLRIILGIGIHQFWQKKLYKAKQAENMQIVNQTIYAMINLRNATIKNEIYKNKNPNKKIGIVEKIRDFNNQ